MFSEIQRLFWGAGNVVYDKTISIISLKLVYEGIKSRLKTLNDLAVILVSLCEFALKLPKITQQEGSKMMVTIHHHIRLNTFNMQSTIALQDNILCVTHFCMHTRFNFDATIQTFLCLAQQN